MAAPTPRICPTIRLLVLLCNRIGMPVVPELANVTQDYYLIPAAAELARRFLQKMESESETFLVLYSKEEGTLGATDIAFSSSGRLFVCDGDTNEVLALDPPSQQNDVPLGLPFEATAVVQTESRGAQSLHVTETAEGCYNFYVAESLNHRVVRFDTGLGGEKRDHIVAGDGSPGAGLKQLDQPGQVVLTPDSRWMFVSDCANDRVLRFSLSTDGTATTDPTVVASVGNPFGLALVSASAVVVDGGLPVDLVVGGCAQKTLSLVRGATTDTPTVVTISTGCHTPAFVAVNPTTGSLAVGFAGGEHRTGRVWPKWIQQWCGADISTEALRATLMDGDELGGLVLEEVDPCMPFALQFLPTSDDLLLIASSCSVETRVLVIRPSNRGEKNGGEPLSVS
eukprot:TRINITY_DN11975_c0_g1_i1.p1 TRINITY_DN11975_c0_g1~~TRINITY_DN11975_c0_g1_i1.p1  ORF type:complete len:396 (+),score=56.53 TRINITY_DN11975_c0_g1_i1:123-1310(+)